PAQDIGLPNHTAGVRRCQGRPTTKRLQSFTKPSRFLPDPVDALPRCRPRSVERGHKNTTRGLNRPDGTFVVGLFPPAANRGCKTPVEKWCRMLGVSSPLVLFERRRHCRREVDA